MGNKNLPIKPILIEQHKMQFLLEELRYGDIKQDSDLDFYKGVVYTLWKIGKFSESDKIMWEENLELRLLQV